jgi:hypothetical protein
MNLVWLEDTPHRKRKHLETFRRSAQASFDMISLYIEGIITNTSYNQLQWGHLQDTGRKLRCPTAMQNLYKQPSLSQSIRFPWLSQSRIVIHHHDLPRTSRRPLGRLDCLGGSQPPSPSEQSIDPETPDAKSVQSQPKLRAR